MSTTEQLASFVVNTRYDDIPQGVIDRAKELVIDAVGAGLAGSLMPVTKTLTDYYARRTKGNKEATVLGSGFKMSVEDATLINGTALHSTELEAVPMKGEQQPAFTVFSALAMAELLDLGGKDVLEGFILGFELHGRLSANAPGIPGRGGWGCVTGTLGAAATAGKLFRFDTDQMRMTLGFASSQTGGLIEHVGTTAHFVELGMAIAHGIRSALWVKEGMTAMPDMVENRKGFLEFYAGKGGYDLEEITRGLGGGSFYITEPGVSIKKYPCCFRTHRALDTTLELMQENRLSYGDVAEIVIDENLYDRSLLKYSEPKIGREARFSMEHCIAAALVDGKVDESSFSEDKVRALKEARSKVKVIVHEEWPPERGAARTPVTIRLKNGKEFQRELKKPKDPSQRQILGRYKTNAGMVLSKAGAKKSAKMFMDLEKLEKIADLMKLLKGRKQ